MKKFYNTIMALCLIAGVLTSCSDDKFLTEGEGAANFSVVLDAEANVVTRASNEAALAENCIVYVYNTKGLIRKYRGTSTLPSQLSLKSGN